VEANITNFSQGEISSLYYGRIDTQFYASAAKEITNMIITPSGSLNKRPGTKYSDTHRYTNGNVRLIPLTVSTVKYMLELGDQYFRIIKDGEVVEDSSDPGTKKEVVTPWGQDALRSLDFVEVDNQIIVVSTATEPRIIYKDGAGDDDWAITTPEWITLSDDEYTPPVIESATELTGEVGIGYKKFSFRSGDVGQRLYLKTNTSKVGYFEITEVKLSKIEARTVYTEAGGDSGETANFEVPANIAIGTYTLIEGPDINSMDTITDFAVQPMNMSTIRPGSVTVVDSRLIFSGFNSDPRKIMGSNVGELWHFRMGYSANLAYEFSIKEKYGNVIYWISGERSFTIGTDEGVFTIGNNEPVTPTTAFQLVRQTAHRCKNIKPSMLGDYMVFVQAPGNQIRLFQYNYQQDSYLTPSITMKAEHMFRDGIVEIAYQQAPVSALYVVLETGDMAIFIMDQENGVNGWTLFKTDGDITAIAVVSGTDGEDDVYLSVRRVVDGNTYYHLEKLEYYRMDKFEEAWYVDSGVEWEGEEIPCTNLHDDGTIVFTSVGMSEGDIILFEENPTGCTGIAGSYVKLGTDESSTSTQFILTDLDDQPLSGFGNSTASFTVRETATSISLPSHYDDGVSVSVFTETGFYTNVVVSGGEATIQTSCKILRAGFPFTSKITTLPVPVRIKDVKQVYEVGVMFFESHAGALKDAEGDLSSNFSMDDDIVLDEASQLWTGVKRMNFYSGQSKYGNITIESEDPTPMNILGITYEIAEK